VTSGIKNLQYAIIFGLILTVVIITPTLSIDPINLPKLVTLSFFAVMVLTYIVSNRQLSISKSKFALLLLTLFPSWILISLFMSKINILNGLFGFTGRNTGALTYFGLFIFMIGGIVASSTSFTYSILRAISVAGILHITYGFVQVLDLDPFTWVRATGSVTSFFGNQNFSSSFTALSMLASLSLILYSSSNKMTRIFWICYQPFAFFILINSDSTQGYFVLIAGLLVIGYFWLVSKPSLIRLAKIYLVMCVCGVAISILDILAKVPWNPFLNEATVALRGDYWRTAWAISMNNPLFGVGLDGYVYQYRAFRDELTASRSGNTRVDSAHNIFLDLLVGGGFPLLIIYLGLILLVLISIFKVTQRSKVFKPEYACLVGAWVGYLLQASISINQIGLGVIGFTLMGVLIGYESHQEYEQKLPSQKQRRSTAYALLLSSIFSVFITFPIFRNDLNLRSAANAADAALVEKIAYDWPKQIDFMVTVAATLRENGYPEHSLRVIREVIKINPNFYEAWLEISRNEMASESEKSKAQILLRKLDPFAPVIG